MGDEFSVRVHLVRSDLGEHIIGNRFRFHRKGSFFEEIEENKHFFLPGFHRNFHGVFHDYGTFCPANLA
ncbi:MAG: hypothetical protein UW95_C0025G0017 [Parcubacteria group bacterium GW2011_GWC1_45_14]|nr:MAG: hypothetical protein UW95_C0025G0017 [Parcubacteria group bacterium GW2011_GWC1_45_14]